MLADAVEQQRGGLVVEISQIGSFETCVAGQILRQVEAEGKLALEPGFYGVAVGGEHLRRGVGGKRGDVLIADFGYERGKTLQKRGRCDARYADKGKILPEMSSRANAAVHP